MRSDEELLALAWRHGRACLLEAEGEYERQRKLIDKIDEPVRVCFPYTYTGRSGEVRPFEIREIEVLPSRRVVDDKTVDEIARSIEANGLISPILIRRQHDDVLQADDDAKGYILVAGRHRLEACRQMGAFHAPCQLIDADDIAAELIEIAENLHRAELTQLQRADQVTRWIELTSAKQEAEAVSRQTDAKPGRPEGGVRAAARELGLSEADARRSVKVAGLTPEAKAVAVETGLADNQSALLAAAKEPTPERQVEALRQKAEPKAAAPIAYRDVDPGRRTVEQHLPDDRCARYWAYHLSKDQPVDGWGHSRKALNEVFAKLIPDQRIQLMEGWYSSLADDERQAFLARIGVTVEPFEVPKFLRRDIEAA